MRFLLAALAVLLLILAARGLSRISGPYLARQRPVTGLLIGANLRAFVVAFAAGSAGIIALGRAKSGAVVGVLVSITTIPAASNIGVALAMGNPSEADRCETRDLSAKAWPVTGRRWTVPGAGRPEPHEPSCTASRPDVERRAAGQAASTKTQPHATGLGSITQVDGQTARLLHLPDDLVSKTVPIGRPRVDAGPGANHSGAVDIDKDFALAHSKDDGFFGFSAGIPLTVHHAPGDEHEVARPALHALGATGAEFQSEAALGLEHIGVVARVHVPAGPCAGFGSGPAGPDVVVGKRLAAVHPGRLGSGAVKRIRSDQGGSVHGGLPSDQECKQPRLASDEGQDPRFLRERRCDGRLGRHAPSHRRPNGGTTRKRPATPKEQGSGCGLQMFMPATGSGLQVLMPAARRSRKSPGQGDACLVGRL